MAGMHEVGLYSVAAQLSMVISLVATAVNQAYSPWLFRRLAAPGDALRRMLVLATYLYFVVALLGAGVVTLLSPCFVGFFLFIRYSVSSQYLSWLSFVSAFNFMYFMVTIFLFFHLILISLFLPPFSI